MIIDDIIADTQRQHGIRRIDDVRTNQISIGKVDVAVCVHIAEEDVGDMGRRN